MTDIVVVGDVMTDIIVRPHGALVHGSDRAASIRQRPGGSGANQAAWIAAQGGRVSFLGRVAAADHAGVAAELAGHGVRPRLAADPALPTGTLVTLLDADGERSFLTDRGANDALCAADLPNAALDSAAWLHVSGYSLFSPGPRAAVLAFAAAARARGLPWSADAASAGFIATVGAAAFRGWTDAADLFVANADEAAALTGSATPQQQLERLGAPARTVIVTLGARGAVAAGPGCRFCCVPADPVQSPDTTGAGDAFLAGVLLARSAGAPLPDCLAAGARLGARAAARLGGRP